MTAALQSYQKKLIVLRTTLAERGFFKALEAVELARSIHTGVRKDGVTPEFSHQVTIASYVWTLWPHLLHPEETISTVMLHDAGEDYGLSPDEIRAKFGELTATAVWRMTKTFRGVKRDEKALFSEMAQDPIASIAKGGDRVHNFQSMLGVFSLAKQKSYVVEGRELFIPMLKQARRAFPQQTLAYENIKLLLLSQMEMLDCSHLAMDA